MSSISVSQATEAVVNKCINVLIVGDCRAEIYEIANLILDFEKALNPFRIYISSEDESPSQFGEEVTFLKPMSARKWEDFFRENDISICHCIGMRGSSKILASASRADVPLRILELSPHDCGKSGLQTIRLRSAAKKATHIIFPDSGGLEKRGNDLIGKCANICVRGNYGQQANVSLQVNAADDRNDSDSLTFATFCTPEDHLSLHNTLNAFVRLASEGENLKLKVVVNEKFKTGRLPASELFRIGVFRSRIEFVDKNDFWNNHSKTDGALFVGNRFSHLGDMLQSISAGIPIIAAEYPEYQQIVADGKTGILVKVSDTEDLIKAMKLCMEHRDFTHDIAKEARHQLEESTTRNYMMNWIVGFYSENLSELLRGGNE